MRGAWGTARLGWLLAALPIIGCSPLEVEVSLPYKGTTVDPCELSIDLHVETRADALVRADAIEARADSQGRAELELPYFSVPAGNHELAVVALEGETQFAEVRVPVEVPKRPVAVRPDTGYHSSLRWSCSWGLDLPDRDVSKGEADFGLNAQGKLLLVLEGCGLASARWEQGGPAPKIEEGKRVEAEYDLLPHLLGSFPEEGLHRITLEVTNVDGRSAKLWFEGRTEGGADVLIARKLWAVDSQPLGSSQAYGTGPAPFPLVILRSEDGARERPYLPADLRAYHPGPAKGFAHPGSIRIETRLGTRALSEVELIARVHGTLEYAGQCGGYLSKADSASYNALVGDIEDMNRRYPGGGQGLEPLLDSYAYSQRSLDRFRRRVEVEVYEARTGVLLGK